MSEAIYLRPRITDYGTIVAMASDLGLLFPGAASGASLSVPVAPGGGGDTPPPDYGGTDVGGEGEGSPPETVDVGGETVGGGGGPAGGGGGGANVGGVELTGGAGGGRDTHPFTGFPAALLAAVGGTLSAVGASLRRAVRRDDD